MVLLRQLRSWTSRFLARRPERHAALRALAELDDDQLSDLSETGQRLRREARRRRHAHPGRSRDGAPSARGRVPAG
jgi:hypothetical protein